MAYSANDTNQNGENNSSTVRVMGKNEKNDFDGITIDDVSNAGAYEDPNSKKVYEQERYEQTNNGFRYTRYSTGGNGSTFRVYRLGGNGRSHGLLGSLFGNSLLRTVVIGMIIAAIFGFILFVAMPVFAVIAVAAIILYFLKSLF